MDIYWKAFPPSLSINSQLCALSGIALVPHWKVSSDLAQTLGLWVPSLWDLLLMNTCCNLGQWDWDAYWGASGEGVASFFFRCYQKADRFFPWIVYYRLEVWTAVATGCLREGSKWPRDDDRTHRKPQLNDLETPGLSLSWSQIYYRYLHESIYYQFCSS